MKNQFHDISVVICAYTAARWDTLVGGIASVRAQTIAPREIILVVDYNPALFKQAREQLRGVRVIENTQPRGLSGARNSGVAVARAALIAFLDDDAIAAPDWLENLGKAFADPEVIGVGGAIEPVWRGKRPAWLPEEFLWVIGCSYRGLPEKRQTVRNVIGGNMCIRRSVFSALAEGGAVGGFRVGIGRDGTIPLGCEETELCIRAQQQLPDRVFLYEPQARVYHCVSPQRFTFSYFRSRCYAEGISKALISTWLGTKDSLATEGAYILRVLPQGIRHGIADALIHRDWSGLGRAAAIVGGLTFTAAGYIIGTLLNRVQLPQTVPHRNPHSLSAALAGGER